MSDTVDNNNDGTDTEKSRLSYGSIGVENTLAAMAVESLNDGDSNTTTKCLTPRKERVETSIRSDDDDWKKNDSDSNDCYDNNKLNDSLNTHNIPTTNNNVNPLRHLAITLSLYINLIILLGKAIAYIQTSSLSVLAALVDSALDVVSQLVLAHTERQSSLVERSSTAYPAGASRLEPVGVLTCAALMGMCSFEVIRESFKGLYLHWYHNNNDAVEYRDSTGLDMDDEQNMNSVYGMLFIVAIKLCLWYFCRSVYITKKKETENGKKKKDMVHSIVSLFGKWWKKIRESPFEEWTPLVDDSNFNDNIDTDNDNDNDNGISDDDIESNSIITNNTNSTDTTPHQIADPTLQALALDHYNDCLSNLVAALALLAALASPKLWFLDPIGAISISAYVVYSWYETGKDQIGQLSGKAAPPNLVLNIRSIAEAFDRRILAVDECRAYHFGPRFLVELEVVLPRETLLFESHDLGMELQYEIEGREEVERCFVHMDYERREYDEHVVSKVPGMRDQLKRTAMLGRGKGSNHSV